MVVSKPISLIMAITAVIHNVILIAWNIQLTESKWNFILWFACFVYFICIAVGLLKITGVND